MNEPAPKQGKKKFSPLCEEVGDAVGHNTPEVRDANLLYLLSSSDVVDDDDEGISADTVLA